MHIKITGLTAANIQALKMVIGEHLVTLTATTAEFIWTDPAEALAEFDRAMVSARVKYGNRSFTVRSLHAPRRKLSRLITGK